MKAAILVCAAALAACGPEKGGESAGGGASSGGDGTGIGATSAPTGGETSGETGSETSGETGSETSGGETTGGGETGGGGESSGGGETSGELPLSVYPMATIPGRPSALDGVPRWAFDPNAECVVTPDPPCGTIPALGEPKFLIDGVFAGPETIAIGSKVAALVPFEHPGCILGCGYNYVSAFDGLEGEESGGSTPADLPCSTEASGLWLALDFGEIERAGPHTGSVRMIDICETSSELRAVEFTPT